MNTQSPPRMDRRAAIKWMLAAGAGSLLAPPFSFGAPGAAANPGAAPGAGYGTDPDLMKPYKPGDIWALTLTEAQRRDVAALSDVIIPAEGSTPSASAVGVTDFVDEWISAPYPNNVADRKVILPGLAWVADESTRRFGKSFADATPEQRLALCEEISLQAPENSQLELASKFFRRIRNIVSTGFFTTPVGMKDLGYVGNVPLAKFEGPPADLVAKLGLTDEVQW